LRHGWGGPRAARRLTSAKAPFPARFSRRRHVTFAQRGTWPAAWRDGPVGPGRRPARVGAPRPRCAPRGRRSRAGGCRAVAARSIGHPAPSPQRGGLQAVCAAAPHQLTLHPTGGFSLGGHRNGYRPLVLLVCPSRGFRSKQDHGPVYASDHALEHRPGSRGRRECTQRGDARSRLSLPLTEQGVRHGVAYVILAW
jgi:hypothetical protein